MDPLLEPEALPQVGRRQADQDEQRPVILAAHRDNQTMVSEITQEANQSLFRGPLYPSQANLTSDLATVNAAQNIEEEAKDQRQSPKEVEKAQRKLLRATKNAEALVKEQEKGQPKDQHQSPKEVEKAQRSLLRATKNTKELVKEQESLSIATNTAKELEKEQRSLLNSAESTKGLEKEERSVLSTNSAIELAKEQRSLLLATDKPPIYPKTSNDNKQAQLTADDDPVVRKANDAARMLQNDIAQNQRMELKEKDICPKEGQQADAESAEGPAPLSDHIYLPSPTPEDESPSPSPRIRQEPGAYHSSPGVPAERRDNVRANQLAMDRSNQVPAGGDVEQGLVEAQPVLMAEAPGAIEQGNQRQEQIGKTRKCWLWLLLAIILAGVSLVLGITLDLPTGSGSGNNATNRISMDSPESQTPTLYLLPNHTQLQIQRDPSSPQALAFQWLMQDPHLLDYTNTRIQQRYALSTVYYALRGDRWRTNSGWLSYDQDECRWFQRPTFDMKDIYTFFFHPNYAIEFENPGQACSDEGILENLWLDQNKLDGSIPLELYMLTNLWSLSMGYDNDLKGTISSYIGHLSNLEFLALYGLETPSPLPSQIGLLTKLQGAGLDTNHFTGTMPTELNQLTNLSTLIIGGNPNMTATIPSNIEQFSNLRWLGAENSHFYGTLPTELGQLKALEWIVLKNNRLTGPIPSQLGQLPLLEMLSLPMNQLTSSIPTELGELSNLFLLSARYNSLTGTLPTELGQLHNITAALSFAANGLTGTLPTELSHLTDLEFLDLPNNALTGSIPSELGLLTKTEALRIGNNSLTGTIPFQMEGMVNTLFVFDVSGNPLLSGTIPEKLCHIENICMPTMMVPCDSKNGKGMMFDCSASLCGCGCSCALE